MKIVLPFENVPESALFDSGRPGPTSVIFSGVHGDEVSGMAATSEFFERVMAKELKISKGRVVVVFRANEQAALRRVRYVEHNLNRQFRRGISDDGSYERRRARELMGILDGADFLLDLHSTSGPSEPFLFCARKDVEFAKKLSVGKTLVGWNELSSDSTAGDTETYVNERGGVAVTFESGNHDDPEGSANAMRVLLNFLVATGQTEPKRFVSGTENPECLEISKVCVCQSDRFRFVIDDFTNFSPISKGTLVAMDGEHEIRAEEDFILVMPNLTKIRSGEDAFFYGKKLVG